MCRWLAYLELRSRLEALSTSPSTSLIHQKPPCKARPEHDQWRRIRHRLHGDDDAPALYKGVDPA